MTTTAPTSPATRSTNKRNTNTSNKRNTSNKSNTNTSNKSNKSNTSSTTSTTTETNPTTSPTRQETTMLTQILDLTPPAWFAKARCQDGVGTLTELFFSEDLGDIARAKAICANCAVAEQCLSAAVDRREPWGVWGGELLMNGKILAARKRRGRPPKVARPELVIDELGQVISA